jgi:hypothetical protein
LALDVVDVGVVVVDVVVAAVGSLRRLAVARGF